MKLQFKYLSLIAATVFVTAASALAVTGDPTADGWIYGGNSLQNGVYVTGSANYGFDVYSAGLTIQSGSNLEISDGTYSWLAGDTVVGVGGQFHSITPAAAGWAAFSGGAVNSQLPTSYPYSGPKLQAKFGTSAATWSTSTTAPGGGNGNSGSSSGGGRVQVRTSAYFEVDTPTAGQTEPWTWNLDSGDLLVLDKSDHILWRNGATDVSPDKRVARMIWVWDDTAKQVDSWELLLDVSLLERVAPQDYAGLFPAIGDKAILTVQNGDGAYTDALISTVAIPEPATLSLVALALGGLVLIRKRK